MSGILVVIEQSADRIARINWEAISAAQQLGGQIKAVVLGAQTEATAAEVVSRASCRTLRVEHSLLSPYSADGYIAALQQLIEKEAPEYVVFTHTYQVRDYAPALATRFGQVLISDVTAIGDGPVFTRQIMQGRLNAAYRKTGSGPCFISVQAGAFAAESLVGGTGSVELFTPTIEAAQIRTRAGEPYRAGEQAVDLSSAQVIVGVGRGIKAQENLPIVEELAAALGAEIAASRPICDAGWLSMERQIGSSGQTVAPKLYIALGISGAIQHIVGMKGSQCIVAINKDPDAPIFEIANYGIAADLLEVVPALTKAIKEARQ